MNVTFGSNSYPARIWKPNIGRIGNILSYDTETTVHDDPCYVEDVVIASAFQGDTVFFVGRQDLLAFWTTHVGCRVFMHTASFDIDVTEKVSGFGFHPLIEAGQIVDIAILWRLCQLATKGTIPMKFSLALLSSELLHVQLNKEDRVRCGFGQFFDGKTVAYQQIPQEFLIYAGQDAVATYLLGTKLENEATRLRDLYMGGVCTNGTAGMNGTTALGGPLSHDIQLRGDIALRRIERHGIGVDPAAVAKAVTDISATVEGEKAVLARYGYVPGKKGNTTVYNEIVKLIEARRHVTILRCPKTLDVSQASDDLHEVADEEFIRAFLKYKDLSKMLSTYLVRLRNAGGRAHPRYGLMTVSGRTTCSSPNVQNLPREGDVRGCFVPTEGHVFVTCDYRMLELCTLAQITYWRYGFSRMRDLINEGVDLHVFTAAQILGKATADITSEERRKAKAVNFGLPGGMGIGGLVDYASEVYSVTLSPTEAETWRAQWMTMFPEMKPYLADEGAPAKLTRCMDLSEYPADKIPGEQVPAMVLYRIAGGAKETSMGRPFSDRELDWAWNKMAESRAAAKPRLNTQIATRTGSRELQRALVPGQPAVTPSGRIRAGCSYCESRNTPFQGAAADGAKLALYDLIGAGYRVVAFIHDEVVVELPETEDHLAAAEGISGTMVKAMKKLCPDVAISTEYAVMRRWNKDAEAVYDGAGRLIPWEPETVRSS